MSDLQAELFSIALDFPRVIRRIYSEGPGIAENLLTKLKIKSGTAAIWAEQFGELTVLYPLLQAEGLAAARHDDVHQANLIHLCLLLYAFFDDRVRDGQVTVDLEEEQFARDLRDVSMSALVEFSNNADGYIEWSKRNHVSYQGMLEKTYADRLVLSLGLHRSDAFRVASARAAFGSFASMALLYRYRVPPTTIRIAQNAFDCLVTGMQWIDDMKDWRDDLAIGDENLLLTTLRGLSLKTSQPETDFETEEAVASALQRFGVLDIAMENARRWLESATRRQNRLGCTRLAELIQDRIFDGEKLRFALARELANSPI